MSLASKYLDKKIMNEGNEKIKHTLTFSAKELEWASEAFDLACKHTTDPKMSKWYKSMANNLHKKATQE